MRRKLTEALELVRLDPESPYKGLRDADLLDRLLADTATNFSESEVIPGATLLSASDRKCVIAIHERASLEEIRKGIDRIIKRQAPIWNRARRRARGMKPHPVRLVTIESVTIESNLLLVLDPTTPIGQLRTDIDHALDAWARARPRPTTRWRRTVERDLDAMAFIDERLRAGDFPTRNDLATELGCSPDQARRSMARAAKILLRRHDGCAECARLMDRPMNPTNRRAIRTLCPIGKWLVERAAGRAVAGDSLRRRIEVDSSDHLDRLFRRRSIKWNRRGHRRQH